MTIHKEASHKISLRHWRESDAEKLRRLFSDNHDLHRQLPQIETEADAVEVIRGYSPEHSDRAVWCIDIAGEAAGLIGLNFEARDGNTSKYDRAWVWYWSVEPVRGKGVMKQLVKAVCDWAQARPIGSGLPYGLKVLVNTPSPEIRRLELGYRLNNPASAKVAEHAGFVVEGIERAKFKIGDEVVDAAFAARLPGDIK